MRFLSLVAGLALAVGPSAAAHDPDEAGKPATIDVMILGSYHFANPGRDVVNMEVDDVLSPKRQRESRVWPQPWHSGSRPR